MERPLGRQQRRRTPAPCLMTRVPVNYPRCPILNTCHPLLDHVCRLETLAQRGEHIEPVQRERRLDALQQTRSADSLRMDRVRNVIDL